MAFAASNGVGPSLREIAASSSHAKVAAQMGPVGGKDSCEQAPRWTLECTDTTICSPRRRGVIRSLVDRILLAAVSLFGMLVSALILFASVDSTNRGDARFLEGIGYTGHFLASIITMRVVTSSRATGQD